MRIFTGAPMPDGADTVFMQEDVRLDAEGRVVLPTGLRPGANVRPAGEDIPVGTSALAAGHRLRPQDVALAAAFGLARLDVRRRIRVAVFSTGNELVSPGGPRAAAQLFDSNRFMLMAMLKRLGCEVSDLGIVGDNSAALSDGIKKVAGTHDLILTTGGVSTGDEDHVKAAVESVGSLVLWRMAIKPGRPVAMGIVDGTPFIGLPGNPVASFVTFVHVVRPTVLALAGLYNSTSFQCRYARPSPTKRRSPAANMSGSICAGGENGVLEAVKFPREGAGLLSSLVDTDGLVELGEGIERVETWPDGWLSRLCQPGLNGLPIVARLVDDARMPSPCSGHDHDKTRPDGPQMPVAGVEDPKGAQGSERGWTFWRFAVPIRCRSSIFQI